MNDLEVMAARDADTGGPACGTPQAFTTLEVIFRADGGMQDVSLARCCYRHMPSPGAILPADAEIERVTIEDAITRTVISDGRVQVTVRRQGDEETDLVLDLDDRKRALTVSVAASY